jgi:hypothetical protein
MKDTVGTARRPKEEELIFEGTKRVRVPGVQIGACKVAGADIEPCILVEVFQGDELTDRILCREVIFYGKTTLTQSVSAPCDMTGAILWLETEPAILCKPLA